MNIGAKEEIELLIKRYGILKDIKEDITLAVESIMNSYNSGGKLLICGNGGSAADSLHIVGELMKSFVLKRRLADDMQQKIREKFPKFADYYIDNLQNGIPSISLVGESALITAYSNDNDSDLVFAQQVVAIGKKEDILFAISTSGNSENVIHACNMAKIKEMKVIGLTGQTGGKMKDICDVLIAAPSNITYQIQELHLPIYHTICLALEKELFEK